MQIISLCECVQMELSLRLCSCKYDIWLPESGHLCGACHHVFDTKVSTRKPLKNTKNIIFTYEYFFGVYMYLVLVL